jgi:hypothetical protein
MLRRTTNVSSHPESCVHFTRCHKILMTVIINDRDPMQGLTSLSIWNYESPTERYNRVTESGTAWTFPNNGTVCRLRELLHDEPGHLRGDFIFLLLPQNRTRSTWSCVTFCTSSTELLSVLHKELPITAKNYEVPAHLIEKKPDTAGNYFKFHHD